MNSPEQGQVFRVQRQVQAEEAGEQAQLQAELGVARAIGVAGAVQYLILQSILTSFQ